MSYYTTFDNDAPCRMFRYTYEQKRFRNWKLPGHIQLRIQLSNHGIDQLVNSIRIACLSLGSQENPYVAITQ